MFAKVYSEPNFKSKSIIKIFRRFSSKQFQEVSIPVPWGKIAGKWWGPTDVKPVLTLHGWQDTCGSFDRLLPVLMEKNKNSYLAIDLPGHGYSSSIPQGIHQNFMSYVLLVRNITKHFQWPSVALMGHSMGAIVSYFYTMLYYDQVDFTICLDAFKPMTKIHSIPRLAKNLDNFFKFDELYFNGQEPPSYTLDVIKQKVCTPHKNSILPEYSHHIYERNIAPSKVNVGKYYFTRDPRLKSGNFLNWPQDELVRDASLIKSPIFILKVKQSSYFQPVEHYYEVLDVLQKTNRDCVFHMIDGTHHVHLNKPETVGALINDFLTKYLKIESRQHDLQANLVNCTN